MSDDHRRLTKDLRDLRVYLQSRFPDAASIPLYVERHYGAQPFEIACVVIGLPDRALRRQVRARAEAALRHLGYRVENRGCDVYDVWPRQTEMSAHDHLRAHGSECWRAKRPGIPARRAPAPVVGRNAVGRPDADRASGDKPPKALAPGWDRSRGPCCAVDSLDGCQIIVSVQGASDVFHHRRPGRPVTDSPGPCRLEWYLREPLAM
jgi:hypothetical protein